MSGQLRTSILSLIAAAVIIPLVAGCMPSPPADDNSEIPFVRETVPKILGRKPRGADEVELLSDISALLGREAVIRTLMAQDEFIDHWTDVLVDHLQLQREGPRSQSTACFGNPLRVDAMGQPISDGGVLAEFIRNNPPTTDVPDSGTNPFNMVDVIRSAIELDDLSPIYRAYVFALNQQPGFSSSQEQRRSNVGIPFNHIYLNHQITCLGCHNSSFSTTNSPDWQRTHAIPLALEKAVYGSAFGNETQNYGFLRGAGGDPVWGIDTSCGRLQSALNTDVATQFAGLNGNRVSLLDVDGQLQSGYDTTTLNGITRTLNPPNLPDVQGDQGYAFMVAAAIANNVWRQIMGESLTIANYYARNHHQMNAHWNLTEFKMLPSGWSLKDLIERIFETRFYNRKVPEQSAGCAPPRSTPGNTPYCLQMVLDPWVERDPRVPDADLDDPDDPKIYRNGQGELVHRYSPRSLLNSIAAALDWPGPQRFPTTSASAYPNLAFASSIGQYISDAKQGSKGVDFQGLLSWEATLGICEKPSTVSTDWIDRFVGSIAAFDAANPGAPLTVEDAVVTMKDWLLQDQNIYPHNPQDIVAGVSEQSALADHFGTTLNTSLSAVPNLEDKLRGYCGVLLQSPQFMLAMIKPNVTFSIPRHRVCNPGQPCTYDDMCQTYSPALAEQGNPIYCGNRWVSHAFTRIPLPADIVAVLCPVKYRCPYLPLRGIHRCAINPRLCELREIPPRCDPRWCDPSPIDLVRPGVFLTDAEAAKVEVAKGVTVLRRGAKAYRPLDSGSKLALGDLLRVPPGAILKITDGETVFATPSDGMYSKPALKRRPIDEKFLKVVEQGEVEIAEALLKSARANPNAPDRYGMTPLMKAAEAGNRAMMRLLLAHGARVNDADARGARAIELAVAKRRKGAITLLRKNGAVVDKKRLKLAEAKPQEEPWYLLVTGPSADKPLEQKGKAMSAQEAVQQSLEGKLRTRDLDIRQIQEQWKKTKFHHRGEAGRLPTPDEAKEALELYMKEHFEKEHGPTPRE